MSHRLRPCLLALLALTLVGSFAWGQAYPCTTSGGTNCRAIIPDQGPPPVPLDSVINVAASGACATATVSRVALDVTVRHDWRTEVGIELINPGLAATTLKAATPGSGLSYPEEDYQQFHLAPTLVGGSATGAWTLRLTDLDNSGYGALDDWTLYLVCGAVPVVTIAATDPVAIENPLSTGFFTVSRSVVTAEALTVPLLITGTAGAGDYLALPAFVTIPANQASVQVIVTPFVDALTEVPETVIATVGASGLYTVGAAATATVTIYDQPQQEIPILDHAGLAALAALLAAAGVWLLRSRQA